MSERRFALVDFTYRGKRGRLRVHEAGRTYALPRAVAHAATKRELVARQRPPHWMPPSIFRPPEVLTEAEVIEAEAELKALQRTRLCTIRRNTTTWCRRAAFSASSRLFDWNGETKTVRTKHSSAIIGADVR